MWGYGSGEQGGKPVRLFEYQPDRSGKHAAAFLKGFPGYLVTDGYAGNQVTDRCGALRLLGAYAAEMAGVNAEGRHPCHFQGRDQIRTLQQIVRFGEKFSETSDFVRKTVCQVKIELLLETYWLWLKTLNPVPGSKLTETVTYAQNQKPYLSSFLEYSKVNISNSFAENTIPPFAAGRKNWLFSDATIQCHCLHTGGNGKGQ